MRVLFILSSLAFLVGCNKTEVIEKCHDRVHSEAKYTAQIVTTDTKRDKLDYKSVSGRAKLQNGFGAWVNHSYSCEFTGVTITKFRLESGW